MSNRGTFNFIGQVWFMLKRWSGALERSSLLSSWTSIAPLSDVHVVFSDKWRNKAPYLPIALLERNYLAPHLEQYAVSLGHSPEAEAKAIASGRFRLSSGEFINLGVTPEWNRGQANVVSLHWAKITTPRDTESLAVNEVSQFNWVYTLVRAWLLSGDNLYAETFWNLLADWMEKNLPNQGPQWVSDEAIARRVLAVTFAVQALRFHPLTSDKRISQAARLIFVSAKRLELMHNQTYSRSAMQGLIVSVALFTAGALWPQLPEADVRRSEGLENLINKGKKFISDDNRSVEGAVDFPMSLLEIYTWAEAILRRENERESLPESLHKNIRTLVGDLAKKQTNYSAASPLFLLSGCSPGDMRPVVAASLILFTGVRYPSGPWDEASLLLCGPLCDSANSVNI